MVEAAIAAAIAAIGLVFGYFIAERVHPGRRHVGWVMGLGAGVLSAVVAYSLVLETAEAARRPSLVGAGMAVGALVYYFGSLWLDRRSESRAEPDGGQGGGLTPALGAVLDGVPESLVIGISAALTGEIVIPLIIAAFIANTAEGLAATPELQSTGRSRSLVLSIWLAILAASVGAAIVGYQVISDISANAGAAFNGFAAGAVIMVLSTSLIPESYEKAGRIAGLMVALGFAIGFGLEHWG